MSILGDIFGLGSSVAGFIGNNSKNTAAKDQFNKQTGIANQQLDLADLIKQAALAYQQQGSGYTDPYGGGTVYDPTTGTWKASLGAVPGAIQGASDSEQLARDSGDQSIRRYGLSQADQIRQGETADADTARRQYAQLNSGIGTVDPSKIASDLSLGRTTAVNAGYDQAQRAANTLSLRTGASAGDALSRLAQSRASAIASAAGNPNEEGLQLADSINSGRKSAALGAYTGLADRGSNFSDVSFNPSTLAQDSTNNLFKTQALDQSKFGAVNDALGTASAGIGSAGAGLRQANQQQQSNTNYANTAQLLSSIGKIAGGGDLGSILSKLGLGG